MAGQDSRAETEIGRNRSRQTCPWSRECDPIKWRCGYAEERRPGRAFRAIRVTKIMRAMQIHLGQSSSDRLLPPIRKVLKALKFEFETIVPSVAVFSKDDSQSAHRHFYASRSKRAYLENEIKAVRNFLCDLRKPLHRCTNIRFEQSF